jgi:hypothetical protein
MELPLYWFNSTLPKAFGRNIYFLTKREGKGVFKKKQFSLSNILNHYIAINFFKKLNDLYVTHGFQCDWMRKRPRKLVEYTSGNVCDWGVVTKLREDFP